MKRATTSMTKLCAMAESAAPKRMRPARNSSRRFSGYLWNATSRGAPQHTPRA